MKFKELHVKKFYDSVRDDVYADFFSLVLEYSDKVMRFGGSFDSKNFVTIAANFDHGIVNIAAFIYVISMIKNESKCK